MDGKQYCSYIIIMIQQKKSHRRDGSGFPEMMHNRCCVIIPRMWKHTLILLRNYVLRNTKLVEVLYKGSPTIRNVKTRKYRVPRFAHISIANARQTAKNNITLQNGLKFLTNI